MLLKMVHFINIFEDQLKKCLCSATNWAATYNYVAIILLMFFMLNHFVYKMWRKERKQQILTFKKSETEKVCHFCLKNYWNYYWSSKSLEMNFLLMQILE